MTARALALVLFILTAPFAAPAYAAQCGGDYNAFIAAFSREAAAAGISQNVIAQALGGVTYDPAVMDFDRRQRGTFRKTFEQYAATRVTPRARQARQGDDGQARRASRAASSSASACRANSWSRSGPWKPTMAATWASCRWCARSRRWRMIAGARSCSRRSCSRRCRSCSSGHLPLNDLRGAYAGEIGQTQFLPSSYIKYGVDFDGNGHVDLRHSVPDVLASTANLLKVNGWQAGAPMTMGSQNFEVMREWNRSEVYRRTLVYFAQQLRE